MSARTKIEWTEATWNPIRGCSRVSEGCRHCYAERVAARFSGPGQPYDGLARMTPSGPRWTGEVRFVDHVRYLPLRWKKPRRVFVNSMSDLFHERVERDWIDRIFTVMALARQHTFQILTKRPDRMAEYFTAPAEGRLPREGTAEERVREMHHWTRHDNDPGWPGWPLPNVWLGVSAEDQAAATERIPMLLATPAAIRFVSAEPLLGPIDLGRFMGISHLGERLGGSPLHWIIVGGESGPGARPMDPAWARAIRGQCGAADVAFFMKQMAAKAPIPPDLLVRRFPERRP